MGVEKSELVWPTAYLRRIFFVAKKASPQKHKDSILRDKQQQKKSE